MHFELMEGEFWVELKRDLCGLWCFRKKDSHRGRFAWGRRWQAFFLPVGRAAAPQSPLGDNRGEIKILELPRQSGQLVSADRLLLPLTNRSWYQ